MTKEQQVEEFKERVRLTPEEMQVVISNTPARLPGEDYSRIMEATRDAQLKKVQNDPDLALIDREKGLPRSNYGVKIFGEENDGYREGMDDMQRKMHHRGFTHSIIPLADQKGKHIKGK